MALSNIFREPRREITESVVGIAAVAFVLGGFAWLDYSIAVASWAQNGSHPNDFGDYLVGATFLLILGGIALGILTVMTHAIGEGICNSLARRGLELRPTRRR